MKEELRDFINKIEPLNRESMEAAEKRQDYLVKVPGSLGRLEDISIQLAGITGEVWGNDVSNQAIILMCGDNGVVDEGVASAPQTVTQMQTINFTKRITGVGAQAKHFDIDLLTVDIGVKLPIPKQYLDEDMIRDHELSELIVNRRIADGTKNFAVEPAMSHEEAVRGILTGIEAAEACKKAGKTLIGVGEMGIGNTTTASAIIAALYLAGKGHEDHTVSEIVERIVGRGGGLSDEGLSKKRRIIEDAIVKYMPDYMTDDGLDVIELIRTVGGFDIAGMVGAYMGAAFYRIPVVIDGVISIAAALLAVGLCPLAKDYMFASHKSKEGGYAVTSELLGIEPMFDLGMRLGEGSGCPIAFKIIEAASAVMTGMKSLDEAQVEGAYLDEFREDGQFR